MNQQEQQDFLDLARQRFKLAASAESENRRESLDDLNFSIGEQWPMDIKSQRQLDGRPCLTMNRLPEFIRQVTNEQRQQRPAMQINPIGDGADVDTAEILQGICRHIEVQSTADECYDIGFDYMVRIGFGCWRIVTDWISQESEDQEIYLKPIDNPFTVYTDPTNKRDPSWCFIIEDLLADEFKRQFSTSKYALGTASLTEYQSVGDQPANWAQTVDGQPHIRIAEYFIVEKSKGDTGKETCKVRWHKISGLDVLDERDWPGKYIPVVKIYGDDLTVNGKRHVAGLVRFAKDPQRAYNYWVSAATERIALAPKAPWVVAEGQIENHEREWEQSNYRNMAVLTYVPKSIGGQPLPPPQRNVVEPGIQGMTEMLQMSVMDLQATTGLNDANLGRPKPDESGKAVLARQKQGDVATLNYSDNLSRGIIQTGKIVLDLIPKVYPAPRIQRIIKPDQTVSHVGIYNSKNTSEEEALAALGEDPAAITKIYDIGTGTYDVAVSVGPSYQSKRQESVAAMMALVSAVPQVMPAIGDLIVGIMDWPQAKEIAARLKKLLPPVLQDSEDQTPEAQLMQAQQQLQALGQQHQELTQALQKSQQIIQSKQVEAQGRLQVADLQSKTQIAIAEINTQKQNLIERTKMFLDLWKELHNAGHEAALAHLEQAHDRLMAQQQAQQAAQSQQADQGHELGMAAVTGAQQSAQDAVQSNGNGGGE